LEWSYATLTSDEDGSLLGANAKFQAMCTVQLDLNNLFVVVCLGWAAFCSAPLLVIGLTCF